MDKWDLVSREVDGPGPDRRHQYWTVTYTYRHQETGQIKRRVVSHYEDDEWLGTHRILGETITYDDPT